MTVMIILIMHFLLLVMAKKMVFLIGLSKINGVKTGEKKDILELSEDMEFVESTLMPVLHL